MKIKEIFSIWASETPLLEMAFERKEAIKKIRNVQTEISTHLVKILAFDAPHLHNHWCNETNGWLYFIRNIKWNRKNRFKPHEYMHWLWEEPVGHGVEAIEDVLYGLINIITERNYKDLPRSERNNYQILEIMHKIYSDLTFDLSKGTVKNIQYYLEKHV